MSFKNLAGFAATFTLVAGMAATGAEPVKIKPSPSMPNQEEMDICLSELYVDLTQTLRAPYITLPDSPAKKFQESLHLAKYVNNVSCIEYSI